MPKLYTERETPRISFVLAVGLMMSTVLFGCEECKNSTECTTGTVCFDGVCETPSTHIEVTNRGAIGNAEDGGVGRGMDGGPAAKSGIYTFSGTPLGGSSSGSANPLVDTDTNCTPCGK